MDKSWDEREFVRVFEARSSDSDLSKIHRNFLPFVQAIFYWENRLKTLFLRVHITNSVTVRWFVWFSIWLYWPLCFNLIVLLYCLVYFYILSCFWIPFLQIFRALHFFLLNKLNFFIVFGLQLFVFLFQRFIKFVYIFLLIVFFFYLVSSPKIFH